MFAVTEGVGVAITRAPALMRIGEVWSRRHMRRAIRDPELRARLTPSYRLGCKRILPSNEYFPALARPNVELVTDGIERITPNGVLTRDGVEHPIDALVCSTGFRIEEVFSRMDIRGRGGVTLTDTWADGIQAHRGTTVAGFPNLAILSGPNTGTGSTSQVYMIEAQIHYVIEMLRALRRDGRRLDRGPARGAGRLQRLGPGPDAAHRLAARRLRQLVPRRHGRQPNAVSGTVLLVLALAPPPAAGRIRADPRTRSRPRPRPSPRLREGDRTVSPLIAAASPPAGGPRSAR